MKTNKSISIGFKYPNYKNFDAALIASCSNLGVKLNITHHSRGWKEAFDKSINIGFSDRKSKYNKDAARPE